VIRPETIKISNEGVPASQINAKIVDPMIEMIMSAIAEKLFLIEPVGETKLPAGRAHDFNTLTCTECGEVMVERYVRIKTDKIACMVCAAKA
jgi:formylmethanofuran dehydrogenase subunit E